MGSANTYAVGLEQGVDSPYPHLRQVVVSSERTVEVDGIETANDPVGAVRDLKVNPVVLGGGIPLFGGHYEPQPFERVATRAFQSGVVVNEYRRVA